MPLCYRENALQTLSRLRVYRQLKATINHAPKTSAVAFRQYLESSLRNTVNGWSATEFEFTPIQPQTGRRRAIDFCHLKDKVGIELELSNQNAVTHDLLKLETAFQNGLTKCGVLVVPTRQTRDANNWFRRSCYATYEYAQEWLRIYSPSLRSPIVVWGV